MAGPFKMKGMSFGNSPAKQQTFTKRGVVDMVTGKETTNFPKDNSFKTFKKTGKRILKQAAKRAGFVGAVLTAYDAIKFGANALHKAKNINYNDPKNAKLAEYKYGSSDKSKNIGKSKQIKKGDKIRVKGPDRY